MNTIVLDPTQDPEQDFALRPVRDRKSISTQPAFRMEVDSDGICWLTFDAPNSSANVFNEATLRELDEHLDAIECDAEIRALVIRSAKDKVFVAGADLKAIRALPPTKLSAFIQLGQSVFSRLAALPIPKIAAIHGACVGGGFELTLACDHRIASDSDLSRIGLPEVQLGLIPGWGGSTRLPRMIGLPKALGLILTGKLLKPAQARKLGVVDQVVPREHLDAVAAKRCKMPARSRRPSKLDALTTFPFVRAAIAWKAKRDLVAKTRGLYAAPLKALEVATQGLGKTVRESLHLERDALLELAKTGEASRLIDLFFRKEEASKKPPTTGHAMPVHDATVVGAGVMGAGIAHWIASRGTRTLMTDISTDAISKGLSRISSLLEEGTKRRAITKKEARETLDRVSTTHAKVPLHHHQIIIEAATENMEVKKKIFADLANRCAPDTILATNTSALSVTELATSVRNPERVIGIHFFNPVHRMPLVEIITHAGNTPDVIATAVVFAQRIGKTPVVVKDSPGFVVNRILMPYLLEAVRLFESGTPAEVIDDAMLEFGMPMGPLRLLDEIGLDVAAHVGKTLTAAFPDRLPKTDLLDRMVAEGKLGKKSGEGFYNYATKQKPHASADNDTGIQERLALIISNEAKLCLDEGVAASARDIDLAMVLGTGYAPFRGGPLQHFAEYNGLRTNSSTIPIP